MIHYNHRQLHYLPLSKVMQVGSDATQESYLCENMMIRPTRKIRNVVHDGMFDRR